MKLVDRMIDGEVYRVLSIGRFASTSSGKLSDEVKAYLEEKGLTAKWSSHKEFGLLLESVEKFKSEAEKLFKTKKVGVLVFVNDSEPDLPIDAVNVKKGDVIEIAYTGENAKDRESMKQDFFEGSDKRGYISPYRRENEWRRPKGA
jgi:hypothetical protein